MLLNADCSKRIESEYVFIDKKEPYKMSAI